MLLVGTHSHGRSQVCQGLLGAAWFRSMLSRFPETAQMSEIIIIVKMWWKNVLDTFVNIVRNIFDIFCRSGHRVE